MAKININCINFDNCVRNLYSNDKNIIATLSNGSYIINACLEHGSAYADKVHISIGRYCSIADDISFLLSMNHPYNNVTTFPMQNTFGIGTDIKTFHNNHSQIIIGNDVWIGKGATLIGGIHIGSGAIIAANAMVTKDVPNYAIVAGNPARIVKYRFSDKIIKHLKNLKWWYWPKDKIIAAIPKMSDIDSFLQTYSIEHSSTIIDDEITILSQLKADGFKIFGFIIDSNKISNAIWKNVVEQYMQYFTNNDRVILTVLYQKGQEVYINEIKNMLKNTVEYAPIVNAYKLDNIFSIKDIMPVLNVFITNKNDESNIAADYAKDFNVELRYGLDESCFD